MKKTKADIQQVEDENKFILALAVMLLAFGAIVFILLGLAIILIWLGVL